MKGILCLSVISQLLVASVTFAHAQSYIYTPRPIPTNPVDPVNPVNPPSIGSQPAPQSIIIPPNPNPSTFNEGMIFDTNTGRIIIYQQQGADTFITTY